MLPCLWMLSFPTESLDALSPDQVTILDCVGYTWAGLSDTSLHLVKLSCSIYATAVRLLCVVKRKQCRGRHVWVFPDPIQGSSFTVLNRCFAWMLFRTYRPVVVWNTILHSSLDMIIILVLQNTYLSRLIKEEKQQCIIILSGITYFSCVVISCHIFSDIPKLVFSLGV